MDTIAYVKSESAEKVSKVLIQIASDIDECYRRIHAEVIDKQQSLLSYHDDNLDVLLKRLSEYDASYIAKSAHACMNIQTDLSLWKNPHALGLILKLMRHETRSSIIGLMENTGFTATKIVLIEAGATIMYASEVYCLCRGLISRIDDINLTKLKQMVFAFSERYELAP